MTEGGDIDLLLITESEKGSSILQRKKYEMLAEIKYNIGDQKIDLKIADKNEMQDDVFLKMIFPASILLHKWK